jgi:hypothetical protein
VDAGWTNDEIMDRWAGPRANPSLRARNEFAALVARVRGKPKGRPRLTAEAALATFERAVRERRAKGLPAETDEDVSLNAGVTARTIGRWRERFQIPYASDVTED